jgi:hypothetical protein
MFESQGPDVGERDREIGRRSHALVAGFCRAGLVPEPTQVWVATSRMFAAAPMTLNHGSRQRTACAVAGYFTHFHRPARLFRGAEVVLGSGRVDLVWELPDGQMQIDELKVGSVGTRVEDTDTLEQIARYQQAGSAAWDNRFAGVRLLPLTSPARALYFAADGQRMPLSDAPVEVR